MSHDPPEMYDDHFLARHELTGLLGRRRLDCLTGGRQRSVH
jgi:hypothetical protein